jgi:folate-binding protein YgfZ
LTDQKDDWSQSLYVEATTAIELDGQYRALREGAAYVEREVAILVVKGAEAAEYLESQVTNEVEDVQVGEGCYAALLDRKGRMQGDMRILRRADDELVIMLEPVAKPAVVRHLDMYRIGRDVELTDISDDHVAISAIGPAAAGLLDLAPLAPEHANRHEELDGATTLMVATDLGFDLLAGVGSREQIVGALAAAGIEPANEAAAEIVRVESGRPRFGKEMTTATIPQEAGINERAVSFTKGCYIGQETVARLHYKGKPNRSLRGLRLDHPAADGDPVRLGERELGAVGTAVISPARGPLALAILRREAEPGARVEVGDANSAEVVELPF